MISSEYIHQQLRNAILELEAGEPTKALASLNILDEEIREQADTWTATVRVYLEGGETAESAGIDQGDLDTDHKYEVTGLNEEDAGEAALDKFHRDVAIKNLDAVQVIVSHVIREPK